MSFSSPSVYQTAAFSAEAVWDERLILLEGYHWVAVLSQRSAAGQQQQRQQQLKQQQRGLELFGSMTQCKERITGWICA